MFYNIVMNKLFGNKQLILVFIFLFSVALAHHTTGVTTTTTMAAAGGDGLLAPHMRPGAPRQCVEWMGNCPPSLRMYFLGGLRVFMDLKAFLCSGDDESPQHRSVLGTINTLNSPKRYLLARGVITHPVDALVQSKRSREGRQGAISAGGGYGRLWLWWLMLAVGGIRQIDQLQEQ